MADLPILFDAPVPDEVTGIKDEKLDLWHRQTTQWMRQMQATFQNLYLDGGLMLTWNFNGQMKSGVLQDGFRQTGDSDYEITYILLSLAERGKNGDLTVDINLHNPLLTASVRSFGSPIFDTPGTTIYTTQANRPSIPGLNGSTTENAILLAVKPDVIHVPLGAFLSVDVDIATSKPLNGCVQIYGHDA